MNVGRIVALLVMPVVVAGCTAGGSSAAPSRGVHPAAPVLGSSDYQLPMAARGFGGEQPAKISNGGDGTGRVTQITWTGWGKPDAYGFGRTDGLLPHYSYNRYMLVRAEVRAYDLGTCQHRPAYRRLSIRRAPRPSAALSPHWTPWGQTSYICSNYLHREARDLNTVVIANCLQPHTTVRVEPTRMIVDCGGDAIYLLSSIHYQRWGPTAAEADAIERYNSCDPSCSAGSMINRRVGLRFFRPRGHGDRTYFACLVLTGGTDETSTLLGQRHAKACRVRGHIAG